MAMATTQALRSARHVLEQLAACRAAIVQHRDECSARVQRLLDVVHVSTGAASRADADAEALEQLAGQRCPALAVAARELELASGGLLTLGALRGRVGDGDRAALAVCEPLLLTVALSSCYADAAQALRQELGGGCELPDPERVTAHELASAMLAAPGGQAHAGACAALAVELATCVRLPLDQLAQRVGHGMTELAAALTAEGDDGGESIVSDEEESEDEDSEDDEDRRFVVGAMRHAERATPSYLSWAEDVCELLEGGRAAARAAGLLDLPGHDRLREQLGELCGQSGGRARRATTARRLLAGLAPTTRACLLLAAAQLEDAGAAQGLRDDLVTRLALLDPWAAAEAAAVCRCPRAHEALMAVLAGP